MMATAGAAGLRRPGPLIVPRDADPRVSLIVLAARRAELLDACLSALPAATVGGPTCETVIVLNGATPEVQTLVHDRVEGARVVGSKVNLGVAGGANLGRGVARGDLLVILHDDATPRPDWLARLVDVADRHPEAGVVGSRVVNPDGTPQGAGWVTFAEGYAAPLRDDPPPSLVERPVDFCASCALLVRSRVWDSLGGLDEDLFPAYCVDTDLGMATWRAGWSVLCALHAEVAHDRGSTSSAEYRGFLVARNWERLRQKWSVELSQHVNSEDAGDGAVDLALERVRLLAVQCHRAGAPTGAPALPSLGTDGFARGESASARAQRLETEVRDEFSSHMTQRQRIGPRCKRAVERTRARLGVRTRLRALLGRL
jgi:GT2 family glycosyltransferase